MADGERTGFQVHLTDEAYVAWRAVADEHGMTTSGVLEMIGRQLAADPGAALDRILDDARSSSS